MRKIISIIFVFICSLLHAQTKEEIDSLVLCTNSKTDTIKILALNELSRLYSGTDNTKALTLAFDALKICKRINSIKFIGYTYNRIGSVYDINNKPDSANYFFIEALKLFESIRDISGKGLVYQNIGVMNYYLDDFDNALKNYYKALELKIITNETKHIGQLYNNIGVVLRRQNKFNEAIAIYRKSLQYKDNKKDLGSIGGTYQNIGKAFLQINKLDSAELYFLKAKNNFEKTNNYKDLATLYTSIAELNTNKNEKLNAQENINKAIEYGNKANAYDALAHIYEMAHIIDTLNHNYSAALIHLKLSAECKQKVFKTEKTKSIEKLQIIYETQKKDDEIKQLNLESEKQLIKRNLLIVVMLLISTLLIAVTYFYIRKRKANAFLQKQKSEIENKTQQIAQQSAEIARLQSQMNPHFVFNSLNAIQQFIVKNNKEKALLYLNDFAKLMRITLNNSEKETITLQEELDFLNLYLDFEQLRFENKFETKVIVEKNLDKETVKLLPMLIQPFAENAVKHGFAGIKTGGLLEIIFELKNKNELHIFIKDNGIGREAALKNRAAKLHESKGLKITENRILGYNTKHNFKCDVPYKITDLMQGTEIEIVLPLIEDF